MHSTERDVADVPGKLTIWERILRFFFGHDYFISYSHHDELATTYAPILAGAISRSKRDVHLDQWGTDAKHEIPPELKRILRLSKVLIVLGSESGYQSVGMDQELDLFIPTKGYIIPIDLGDSIQNATWWNKLEGLQPTRETARPGSEGCPSNAVMARLLSTRGFLAARKRRAIAIFVAILLLVLSGIVVQASLWNLDQAKMAQSTAEDAANLARNQEETAKRGRNEANNRAIEADKAANTAKNEARDAANNAAEAKVREKTANNRALDANNAANIARNQEKLANKGKEIADIEAARQGRISAANNTIASILDQPNVDSLVNLTVVGSAFRALRADESPTNTSMNWISRNLPKVPQHVWADSLDTPVFGGFLDSTSHKLSLLTRTKLVVFDLNSKIKGQRQEFRLDEPLAKNAKSEKLRFEVLSAPNGNTVLWERGQGLFAVRNGRVVRILKDESPPNIALAVPGTHDSTIACYHLHGGSQAVDIIDLDHPDQSKSFDYGSSRVSGLVALAYGGYAWVNSNSMTVAMKGPKGFKKDSYELPEEIRGGAVQYFGISPGDANLKLIVNKDSRAWVAIVNDRGIIETEPLAFPITPDDNRTSKLIVDPLYKRARRTMQQLEREGNRNPSFFLTLDNGPNLVEAQPISAQLEADRPILKFFMPEHIRGAGFYWLSSPETEKDPFDPTRPFRVASWGQDGAIEVCDYDPRPLFFDAGRVQDPRYFSISPGSTRVAIDEAKTHKITVGEFISGDTRFRMGASKEIEEVGQYFLTDRYLVKSGHEKNTICVYDLRSLAEPEKHAIRIPVEKFDRKPKPNHSGLKSLGLQVLKIEVGLDDNLYFLLQDNICHRKVMMITQNWQQSEGNSRFVYMGPGDYFRDSLFQVHGTTAVFSDTDKTLCMWTGKKPKSLDLGQEEPLCVRYNTARKIWAVGTKSRVVFFDMAGNYLPRYTITLPLRAPNLPSMAFGIDFGKKDGNVMAVIGGDSCVRFYDLRSNSLLSVSSVDHASEVRFLGQNDEFVFTSGRSVAQVYTWKPDAIGEILQSRVDSYGVPLPTAKSQKK